MAKYLRLDDCVMCGGPVIYDSEKKTISCKCGVAKNANLSDECLREYYKFLSGDTDERKTRKQKKKPTGIVPYDIVTGRL